MYPKASTFVDENTLRPFFIVGHPRSGTTLLRFMLSSHSHLYVPAETGFLPFLDIDPAAELDRDEVADLLRRIGRLNRAWEDLVSNEEAFYAGLPRPALPFVLDALFGRLPAAKLSTDDKGLYRRQMAQEPTRWGDKTPLYIRYIPQIRAIFPGAQFIHMIRDGRDAALSARAKWGHSRPYMDLSYLLHNWVRNVRAGRESGRLLGRDRYYECRYESLVTDPEASLRALCDFLGEPYDPSMLDYQRVARRQPASKGAHLEAREVLHSGSIGRWRREMTPFQRQLAQTVAGPLLAELGYAPDEDLAPLSTAGKLRLTWLSARFKALDSLRDWLYRRRPLTLSHYRRQGRG